MKLTSVRWTKFWSKINKTDTCWLWTGGVTKEGYGQFRVDGKQPYVHRITYQLFNRSINDKLVIDHLCKTKTCVNPSHLEAVTQHENILRGILGKDHHNIKKTHCPKGHPYNGNNLYTYPDGRRGCKKCSNSRHTFISKQNKERYYDQR